MRIRGERKNRLLNLCFSHYILTCEIIDHESYVFKAFGTKFHYNSQDIFPFFCHFSALLAFTFLWQLFIWEAEQVYSHHSLIHSWAVKKHNLGKNAISLLHKVSFLHLDISNDLIGWISYHLKQEGRNVWYVQIVILKVFLLSAPKWLHFILKFLVWFLCVIVVCFKISLHWIG